MQKLQIVKRGKELLLVVQRWALQAGRTYAAYVFLLAFFLAAKSAIAATLEGRVVALNDGDTVPYMLKADQSIDDLRENGRERAITKGITPKPKSGAGRPRSSH